MDERWVGVVQGCEGVARRGRAVVMGHGCGSRRLFCWVGGVGGEWGGGVAAGVYGRALPGWWLLCGWQWWLTDSGVRYP